MSLKERLEEDLISAMRARDELKRSVLRLVKAAIKNQEVAKRKPLEDEDVIAVLTTQVRQRRESIEGFRKGNREDMAAREEAEMVVLLGYLPEQLSADEIKELALKAIEELGARGPTDKGKVMGKLMSQVKGKTEGSTVNQVVSELLEQQA